MQLKPDPEGRATTGPESQGDSRVRAQFHRNWCQALGGRAVTPVDEAGLPHVQIADDHHLGELEPAGDRHAHTALECRDLWALPPLLSLVLADRGQGQVAAAETCCPLSTLVLREEKILGLF